MIVILCSAGLKSGWRVKKYAVVQPIMPPPSPVSDCVLSWGIERTDYDDVPWLLRLRLCHCYDESEAVDLGGDESRHSIRGSAPPVPSAYR